MSRAPPAIDVLDKSATLLELDMLNPRRAPHMFRRHDKCGVWRLHTALLRHDERVYSMSRRPAQTYVRYKQRSETGSYNFLAAAWVLFSAL